MSKKFLFIASGFKIELAMIYFCLNLLLIYSISSTEYFFDMILLVFDSIRFYNMTLFPVNWVCL